MVDAQKLTKRGIVHHQVVEYGASSVWCECASGCAHGRRAVVRIGVCTFVCFVCMCKTAVVAAAIDAGNWIARTPMLICNAGKIDTVPWTTAGSPPPPSTSASASASTSKSPARHRRHHPTKSASRSTPYPSSPSQPHVSPYP